MSLRQQTNEYETPYKMSQPTLPTKPQSQPPLQQPKEQQFDIFDNIKKIDTLNALYNGVKLRASDKNSTIGGVVVATNTLVVHEAIKARELPYNESKSPLGKLVWKRLKETQKKMRMTNKAGLVCLMVYHPSFVLLDTSP